MQLLIGPPLRDAVPGQEIALAGPEAVRISFRAIKALDDAGLI